MATVSLIDNQTFYRHYGIPHHATLRPRRLEMAEMMHRFWTEDEGQDIAEYAVMLAVILVLVVGTIRLIGTNSNTAFSNVASAIQ